MDALLLGGTLVCIVANAVEVLAKVRRANFVLRNASEIGLGDHWLPWLAAAEGAGVLGLVIGLARPQVGLAAGAGLLLFFTAAVAAHLRARVLHNVAFPLTYLALAGVSTAFFAS